MYYHKVEKGVGSYAYSLRNKIPVPLLRSRHSIRHKIPPFLKKSRNPSSFLGVIFTDIKLGNFCEYLKKGKIGGNMLSENCAIPQVL
jgi:hypothetical protein